ncbi:hypothetical protein ACVIM5_006432 [Bradyrhizobium sp. USDA 4512]
MVHRTTTAQTTGAMRRWGQPAFVTFAAMVTLASLTGGVAAKEQRPAAAVEATAPRTAGEPIMAIVSIKAQKVTLYDAEGWIYRAPGVERCQGTRDAGRRLCADREGQGPPLDPL